MLLKQKKAQSVLEYVILFAVVVAALLIMQVFIKRGYQGGLKDSADKMGEQFSAGGTATEQSRTITGGDQNITEETATNKAIIDPFLAGTGKTAIGLEDKGGVYSLQKREGGTTVSETKVATDAATLEKTKWGEYNSTAVDNYPAAF